MSKFIWKWRYAWQVKHLAGINMWTFGWYCAGEALYDIDYKTECPIDTANDEMSYWHD